MRIVKDHDERKDEILDTAEMLFNTRGYDSTTINDILKVIGIAKGTFYHYFKSKEEVMDAVIMRIIVADMVTAREIVSEKESSALDRLLKFLLTQSSDNNEQKEEMLEQFPRVENVLMKQRAMEATLKFVCPILKEIIEEGNQSKEFNTPYPLEAIQFLVAGIQSLMDQGMKDAEVDMEQRMKAFIEFIFRVLGIDEDTGRKLEITEKLMQIFKN